MAPDIMEDIEELQQLLQNAKRPRVQAILSSGIANLQKGVGDLPAPAQSPLPASAPTIQYSPLESFSWDQDDSKVKIYISLAGVASDKIASRFSWESFDLKIHDVDGRNYQCGILKLYNPIVPEESSVVVKPKRLIVNLKKKEKLTWTDLRFEKNLLKNKLDDKEPMAGIMTMMKDMYQDGDAEMKRAIAQAWTDARSGKTSGSM